MIERVEVVVYPRVMQINAIKEPKIGLEGKFSVYHAGPRGETDSPRIAFACGQCPGASTRPAAVTTIRR